MVRILFLIVFLTSSKCSSYSEKNSDERKNYLEMELSFSADSVKSGEYISVNVLYINRTDTLIKFYPEERLALIRQSIMFENEIFTVHDFGGKTYQVEIKRSSTYMQTFNILADPTFFHEGVNRIRLAYVCKEMKSGKEVYKLCGNLISQEVKLFVMPP